MESSPWIASGAVGRCLCEAPPSTWTTTVWFPDEQIWVLYQFHRFSTIFINIHSFTHTLQSLCHWNTRMGPSCKKSKRKLRQEYKVFLARKSLLFLVWWWWHDHLISAIRLMLKKEACFRPVSSRGPFACEANVITTTLRKLTLAFSRHASREKYPSSLRVIAMCVRLYESGSSVFTAGHKI